MTQLAERFIANQHSIARYTAVLKDETGTPVSSASVTTLTLTLYNLNSTTLAILNSRDHVNALNANNVTLDTSGNLAYTMQPADNVVGATIAKGDLEPHRVLFEFTWSGGVKRGSHEVTVYVRKIDKIAIL